MFRTIKAPYKGIYRESGSRFLSFAYPIAEESQVKDTLRHLQSEHKGAVHFCYAYALGEAMQIQKSNDDGEPAGSAGKPILNQILSMGITDVLLVVVRYYGGVKLGIPGLIRAYKTSAAYIKGWSRKLGDILSSDDKFFFRAVIAAVRAAKFIVADSVEKEGRKQQSTKKKKEKPQPKATKKAVKENPKSQPDTAPTLRPQKNVSASVNQAIKDLIEAKKIPLGLMEATMLYRAVEKNDWPKYKRSPYGRNPDKSMVGQVFEKIQSKGYVDYEEDYYAPNEKSIELHRIIQGRLDTLRAKEGGQDMFPQLAGLSGKFPIKIGKIDRPLINNDEVPTGNIYLDEGNSKEGYIHIIKKHSKELNKANLTVVDLLKWISNNFTDIYFDDQNKTYWIVCEIENKKYNKIIYACLKANEKQHYYHVLSAGWREKRQFKKVNLLWHRNANPLAALHGLNSAFVRLLGIKADLKTLIANGSKANKLPKTKVQKKSINGFNDFEIPSKKQKNPIISTHHTDTERLDGFLDVLSAAASVTNTAILLKDKNANAPISAANLQNMKFDKIFLGKEAQAFLGDPEPNAIIMITGEPGQGKSTLMLWLANQFAANVGKTLFLSMEEGISDKFRDKIKRTGAHPNLMIDTKIPTTLQGYNAFFIDSKDSSGMKWSEILALHKTNPKCAIAFIARNRKDGVFKGESDLKYDCDIEITVAEGKAYTTKNRFAQLQSMAVPGVVWNPVQINVSANESATVGA